MLLMVLPIQHSWYKIVRTILAYSNHAGTVPFSSEQITRKSQNDDETTMVALAYGHCCFNSLLQPLRFTWSVGDILLETILEAAWFNKIIEGGAFIRSAVELSEKLTEAVSENHDSSLKTIPYKE